MERPAGLIRHHGLTLLITLGMVYVFLSGTLPALLDRRELAGHRARVDAELEALRARVGNLQDWNAAVEIDPLLRERLIESRRRSPDAVGYRILPDPDAAEDAR